MNLLMISNENEIMSYLNWYFKSLLSGKIISMHFMLRFLTSFEMTINELREEGRLGLRLRRKPNLPSSKYL
jgi:hypothetical protein